MLTQIKTKLISKAHIALIFVIFSLFSKLTFAATPKVNANADDQPGYLTAALGEDVSTDKSKAKNAKNKAKEENNSKVNNSSASSSQTNPKPSSKSGGKRTYNAAKKHKSSNVQIPKWMPEMGENPDSAETIAKKEKEREDAENLTNDLSNLNYNTYIAPAQLIQAKREGENKHIPPVYFQSDYLSMIIKSIDKDDFNSLRTLLDNYDFINEPHLDGDTILVYAIQNHKLNSARILLTKGADVNSLNNRKRTALHYAAALGDNESIRLLLSMGANITAKDDMSMTPQDYANFAQQVQSELILSEYINNK